MRNFLSEIMRRSRPLAVFGWAMALAIVVMVAIAPFESRTVAGINPWIKPIKFAFSVGIYVWTLAWFLGELKKPRWAMGLIGWGVTIAMFGEMYVIISQAARGVTSHFNIGSTYDGVAFGIMGGLIAVNALFDLLLLGLFFRRGLGLAPAYLWGIRLGTIVFLLGSAVGQAMLNNMAHTVGAADGGPGLPLLNWSTIAGDLRIAHSMGLHAFQIIPLFGYFVSTRRGNRSPAYQIGMVVTFSLIYAYLGFRLYQQALAGRSIIGG